MSREIPHWRHGVLATVCTAPRIEFLILDVTATHHVLGEALLRVISEL